MHHPNDEIEGVASSREIGRFQFGAFDLDELARGGNGDPRLRGDRAAIGAILLGEARP